MTDIDLMADIESAFDAEIKKLTAQREAMTAVLFAINDMIAGNRLTVVVADDTPPPRLVMDAEFDGPTRIVLTVADNR
jgi:hypothetical protein